MKRLYVYCLLAIAGVLLSAGCKDDPEAEPATLEVSCSEETAIPYEGGDVKIIIETNTSWSAVQPQEDDWYTLTPTSGTGNAEIKVTASTNTANDARTGKVTIQAGTLEQSVEFSQLGRASVPPAAAGTIEGKTEGSRGETITLTIATIEGATSYRWYKDGVEIQTSEAQTLDVTESGKYKVAGLNAAGLGEASPEKEVKFDNTKFLFTEGTATYEGGDFNYEYHVRLTSPTATGGEVGVLLVFCEEEPETCDDPATTSITLPAREYLVTQPLYNNYTAVGVVEPSTSYTTFSYFFATENGEYIDSEYLYFRETGGFEANKDNWAYDFAKVKVEYDAATKIYKISGNVPCYTTRMEDGWEVEDEAGYYEFSYEGPLSFKNNWREYNVFYYTQDNLDEDFDLGTLEYSPGLVYKGKVDESEGDGHCWQLELWQNPLEADVESWDIRVDFYTPAANGAAAPYGTYTVAEEPRKGVAMTADRGYYLKPDYFGLKLQYWSLTGNSAIGGPGYNFFVLGQPNDQSKVTIEDNGSGGYKIEVVMFDSKGHKITAKYNGALSIVDESESSTTTSRTMSVRAMKAAR